MSLNYKTCRIPMGKVTLRELAEHFKLDPAELRWFHNKYCPVGDLIDPDIQPHVEIIYIPVPGTETGYFRNKKQKKPFYRDQNVLDNSKKFERTYGIVQKVEEQGREKQEMHYTMKVKKSEQCKMILMRESIYLNEKRPDFVMERIADEVGSIFYPMQLELYETGKLKHIDNFSEIQKRWTAKKEKLTSYYKGEIVEKLIENLDQQLEYRGKTQRGILDSLFFVLYFFPLYEKFEEDHAYSLKTAIPVYPKEQQIGYDVKLTLHEEVTDEGKFMISVKGKYIDSENEEKTEYEKTSGNLNFTYMLNAMDNSISSISGMIDLSTAGNRKSISFECYETEE